MIFRDGAVREPRRLKITQGDQNYRVSPPIDIQAPAEVVFAVQERDWYGSLEFGQTRADGRRTLPATLSRGLLRTTVDDVRGLFETTEVDRSYR